MPCMDMINIGSPEKFCLCEVVHLWSFFFLNGLTKLIEGYFTHKGCPKVTKWPYINMKIGIYGCDQNIESLETFAFLMRCIFGAFIKNG